MPESPQPVQERPQLGANSLREVYDQIAQRVGVSRMEGARWVLENLSVSNNMGGMSMDVGLRAILPVNEVQTRIMVQRSEQGPETVEQEEDRRFMGVAEHIVEHEQERRRREIALRSRQIGNTQRLNETISMAMAAARPPTAEEREEASRRAMQAMGAAASDATRAQARENGFLRMILPPIPDGERLSAREIVEMGIADRAALDTCVICGQTVCEHLDTRQMMDNTPDPDPVPRFADMEDVERVMSID